MMTYEDITSKLITLDEAMALFTPEFRKENYLVFTNGCFDVLHRGHVYYLSKAREMGDLLVIGLNSDDSVTRLKGEGRPVNDQQSRAEVLGALAFVDYIILFEEDTPMELITSLRPDILVKGGDYKLEEVVGHREVATYGGKVTTIPVVEGYSSTSIIKRTS
jgi:D-beta-D-heptose 7-phosphate kinase/D-beta-D-heptose 1-phosphate adenosyltransferase